VPGAHIDASFPIACKSLVPKDFPMLTRPPDRPSSSICAAKRASLPTHGRQPHCCGSPTSRKSCHWAKALQPPVAVLVCALLAAPSLDSFDSRLRAQSTPASSGAGDVLANTVRPGDLIRLKIWREPEMSGDIPVNEEGVATLPRIGPLQVGNLAADSLKRMLIRSYAVFLRDPAVDITVLRRVTILGAVRTPNVYHLEPTMTVAEALALAGGVAPEGKQDQVEVRREGSVVALKLSRRVRLADTPLRSGDELYVPQRSWLSRNTGLVLGGLGTVASIIFLFTNR
jgi:protein involved in polysaccharide export with SLBB domain